MVTMLLAGYLGPAVVGLGAVGLLIAGHSLGLLWLFVILLALLLLQIRNFYGFVLVVGCAVVLILVSWYLPATMQSGLAYVLTWTLLARRTETGAGADPSTASAGGRHNPTRTSLPADSGPGESVGVGSWSSIAPVWSSVRYCSSGSWPSWAKRRGAVRGR